MSDEHIDVNKILGHAASKFIETFFKSAGTYTRDQLSKFKIRFGRGFSAYLSSSLTRYSQFKTLLNRYESVPLKDYYVPAHFRMQQTSFRDDDFFEVLKETPRIIIEGQAGLGKTLFVRHLFRTAILERYDRIPILFELRYLQLDQDKSLIYNLVEQIATFIQGFSEEHLRFGLQHGTFIVFLDGLDEISLNQRTRYSSEILDLSYRYVETPFILSTRRDDFYLPWESFQIIDLLPMTRNQTLLMLEKMKFDVDAKRHFVTSITPSFFDQHAEFLSTPLLATLMMMTYGEFANVPAKMYIFYEQAFQTLFHKHDAVKGAFSRTIESGLDIEEFRRLLCALCFISYANERFTFLHFQIMEDIRLAGRLSNVDADPELILADLLVTVCLIQRDGQYFTFIHRAFQEYFTALFIVRSRSIDVYDVIEKITFRGVLDNVGRMTFQLDEEVVEQGWVLWKLEWLEGKIGQFVGSSDYELLRAAFGSIYFSSRLLISDPTLNVWKLICDMYNINNTVFLNSERDRRDEQRISTYIAEQRALADKGMVHDRTVLSSAKRRADGEGFSLSLCPDELIESLESVNDFAKFLRDLIKLRTHLSQKQIARKAHLRSLIPKLSKDSSTDPF